MGASDVECFVSKYKISFLTYRTVLLCNALLTKILGFIVSPILIGLWIKSLHGKQKKRNSESKLEAKDVRLIGPVKSAYRTDVQLREVAGKGFAE
mmetsp:Transcript_17180/g.38693  ORF Transcript_17180/g.38693 Transcript_17180/m.38693 type:complete len:95 (-) Transcript_17180:128-412(-)